MLQDGTTEHLGVPSKHPKRQAGPAVSAPGSARPYPLLAVPVSLRQMRWTELALIPTAFAIIVAVQWVASAGGSVWVSATTRSAIRPEWWDARGSCLITQKTVVTRLHKAFLPAPHTGLRLAGPAHNLIGADTVCAQQDDLGPPDMLMRCVAIPYDRAQTAAIGRLEKNGNSGSHAPDLHATSQTGIPSRIQMSDLIH